MLVLCLTRRHIRPLTPAHIVHHTHTHSLTPSHKHQKTNNSYESGFWMQHSQADDKVSATGNLNGAVCPPAGWACAWPPPESTPCCSTAGYLGNSSAHCDNGGTNWIDTPCGTPYGSIVDIELADKDGNVVHTFTSVTVGMTFTVVASMFDGATRFPSEIRFSLFDQDAPRRSEDVEFTCDGDSCVRFHTSCSYPLNVGDSFGHLKVVDFRGNFWSVWSRVHSDNVPAFGAQGAAQVDHHLDHSRTLNHDCSGVRRDVRPRGQRCRRGHRRVDARPCLKHIRRRCVRSHPPVKHVSARRQWHPPVFDAVCSCGKRCGDCHRHSVAAQLTRGRLRLLWYHSADDRWHRVKRGALQ